MCGFWGLNYGGSSWIWMFGFSLLRWALFIGAIVWIVKTITKNSNRSYFSSNKAVDLLHERYVNGEITEEEYLHKKKILND